MQGEKPNNMNQKEIVDNLNEIQSMGNHVLILYNAHAKGNKELTDLANVTFNILWSYAKSLVEIKLLLNATLRFEQDYAIGGLCITMNECTKKIIGYTTEKRKKSLWIDKFGKYITRHPELNKEYKLLKEKWISFADKTDIQTKIKEIRDTMTHGDEKLDEYIILNNTPTSDVIKYLNDWGRLMWSTANMVFTCFENECKHEMKITM